MTTRTLSHRASATTRTSLALRSFVALAALAGAVMTGIAYVAGAHELAIRCDRDTGTCTMDRRWPWSSPLAFPIAQAAELAVLHDDARIALGYVTTSGSRNFWTDPVAGDEASLAALQGSVESLHAFAGADAPSSLVVSVPNGTPMSGPAVVVVLLFGLWMIALARRQILSVDVALDDAARTVALVVRRWWARPVRREIPYAKIRDVKVRKWKARYVYLGVVLELEGEPALPIVLEYFTEPAEASATAVGRAIADAARAARGDSTEPHAAFRA